uniref:TFIIS N-terminal domain-containing protein n=1 Tax=Araucaria cunninghamii TaxID=56994 RepID=A0A0D6R8F8_ARACU
MTEILGRKMGSVEKWRKFFDGAGADICSVIEYAILVAASDCPNEFRRRRDKIAEKLYTARVLRCWECDALTLAAPEDVTDNGENGDEDENDDCSKGCHDKVNSSTDDADRVRVSNYSYDEAEALTEEIEEESETLCEVFRIKDILANPEESDSQLFESLRRLELMQLSVETLKATEIGKQVNQLRKHNSKRIRNMVKQLIRGWKDLVDEWVKSADNVAAVAMGGTSSDSVSPATVDDESGLPSPPLEEGAFLATQTTSVEISQFFDGMDDDGNLCIPEKPEDDDYEEDEKQCTMQEHQKRKQPNYQCNLTRNGNHNSKQDIVRENVRSADRQSNLMRSANHMVNSSGPGRPPVARQERKTYADNVQQKSDSNKNQTKSSTVPTQHKLSCPDDAPLTEKLEAAKRKLQERYQQEQTAKRQRTVQVMELQDLPKQGNNHVRQFHGKPVPQHHRQWNNSRRY